MEELRYHVVIDSELGAEVTGVVALGDFKTSDHPFGTAIYPELEARQFFQDLILGRPFPLTMVTRGVESIGTVLAMTVFMCRDLALYPTTQRLFDEADLVDRSGVAGLAHIDNWHARLFRLIRTTLARANGRQEQQVALDLVHGWLREYIVGGTLPAVLPPEVPAPRILERGTNGFVMAHAQTPDLERGWEALYREGFLRGFLLAPAQEDRWLVLGARKSLFVALDLEKAAEALNEAESAMGEPACWQADQHWLLGPKQGTLILPSAILQLLIRM